MELLAKYLMEQKVEHFVVSIDYFSGYIMVDALASEATEEVKKITNSNFRKFGFPEKIQTMDHALNPTSKPSAINSTCNI